MSITDELRKSMNPYVSIDWLTIPISQFEDIADRIDAEHESEISRAAQLLADAEKDRDFNYANWQDCKQKVLQHNITIDELDAEIERLKVELAHCIKLPKDADGEPIRIGDMLEEVDHDSRGSVGEMRMLGDGWWVFVNGIGRCPDSYRHYKQPTVEGVLRDMHMELDEVTALYVGEVIDSDERDHDVSRIFAEYAKRLKLAGEDE